MTDGIFSGRGRGRQFGWDNATLLIQRDEFHPALISFSEVIGKVPVSFVQGGLSSTNQSQHTKGAPLVPISVHLTVMIGPPDFS